MNIIATAVLLVITLLVVPVISYFTGAYPEPLEWAALQSVSWVLLTAWIMLMTLPTIVALQNPDTPLGWLDMLAAALMVLMLVIETVADQQQWRYQAAKKMLIETGQPLTGKYARGFVSTGLWARSRHPNYFAEQGAWIAFYLFSVAASGQWLNWSISGCILLVVLFRGSSNFSEEISAGKYPDYACYQETVPRFIPLRFR